MTTYYMYLTNKFAVEASVVAREDKYLCTIDIANTLDLVSIMDTMQAAVDGTLLKLEENRLAIVKDKEKVMN